jgi:regulator of nucleoside diphosphate kinase
MLNSRLEDAEPVALAAVPAGLVTMNSTIEMLYSRTGKRRRVTLAYPEDCEFLPDGISVLEPLGMELLGAQTGDVVRADGRQFRITRIIRQPEAEGALHL